MEISYDPTKNAANIADRDLPFDLVAMLDWTTALVVEDSRYDYPELRYTAIGRIAGRAYVVIFTPTDEGIRVISFRKANAREVKRYEKASKV